MDAPQPHESAMCAVCYRVLDWHAGLGWAHTFRDLDGEDHPAVPVPVDPNTVIGRCDFCLADDPAYTVPTGNHRVSGVAVSTTGAAAELVRSTDDWAACDECAHLILTNQWNRVRDRSVDAFQQSRQIPASAELRATIGRMHRAVRKAMTGPPVLTSQLRPNPGGGTR